MFKQLDEQTLVAGQIAPGDIAAAAALGVTYVVNNRPDGEAPDQPAGAEIAAAAAEAGLGYTAIPVGQGGLFENQVVAMQAAIEAAPGKLLAFCRSGTRSTMVWALARSRMGDDAAALSAKAAAQGYDLTPIMPFLQQR